VTIKDSPMLARVLRAAVLRGASDVHAKAGDVFRARVDGELVPLTKQLLTTQQTRALAAMFAGIETDDPRIETLRDFDCSWGVAGVGRFRVNVLRQRSSFMMVLRVIPFSVPTPEKLGLPDVVSRFAELRNGLVLVTGRAGSGKTSTIAAMVHHINRSQKRHIVTLEDPIEYLHRDLTGSISQRELGTDTDDLATGLQAVRRQDPDVVVISELREPMAIDQAMLAAEADCLVLAGVTAQDTAGALFQLVAAAPPDERDVYRLRLAGTLRAVVNQRMVFRAGEGGKTRSKEVQVEWVEVTRGFRDALIKSADPLPLRKAIAMAAKGGHAELFPDDGDDEDEA
jgi:twitching motility protein PilT